MSEIKPRPTLYKGIQMRSRLEADYAAHLDREGADWKYEPTCFASDDAQWLPDFRIVRDDLPNSYQELKSAHLLERSDGESQTDQVDRIDAILARMKVAWESEPDAWLELVFWSYGAWEPPFVIIGHCTRPWMAFPPGLPPIPLVWTGMDQLVPLMCELPAFRKESA